MTQHNGELGQAAIEAMKAVVRIHVEGYNDNNCQSILDPRFAIPLQWTGSGFFVSVDGEEGLILTNAHVARNAKVIQCMSLLTSEEYFQLELVGLVSSLDPDIALLRLPAAEKARFERLSGGPLPALQLASSAQLRRGLDIKAIGYPMGMAEPNISGGEISNFISGDFNYCERIVTDAAINPGNSGGPAIMNGGFVAGLNTATITEASNIGFITPSFYCDLLIKAFLENHETRLAHLGTALQKNAEANAKWLGLEQAEGVILTKVYKKSMCARAGLKKWDVLLGIDKYRFDRHGIVRHNGNWAHHLNMYDIMRRIPVGTEVTLHYWRDGEVHEAKAKARPMPKMRLRSQSEVARRRYINFQGLIVQEACYEIVAAFAEMYDIDVEISGASEISDRPCMVITHIVQGSEAESLELELGEVIRKVNDNHMHSLKDLRAAIRDCEDDFIRIETRAGHIGVFSNKNLSKESSKIRKVL